MAIIRKITKKLKKKNPTVDPRLYICIECGSEQVIIKGKKLSCKSCGIQRKLKKTSKLSNLSEGQFVRIVEYGKPSKQVYKIRKIKTNKDGNTEYLLKSDESEISLLYHESINSHLQKVRKILSFKSKSSIDSTFD